jgi:acylpyruvate hydrolase
MRLLTVRIDGTTAAGRVDGDTIELLDALDVGEVLARGVDTVPLTGQTLAFADADLAPVVIAPRKVICCGLNYRSHILEVNRGTSLPIHPTLFAKFADTLAGGNDDIPIPSSDLAATIDWEVELTIVIGKPVKRASDEQARAAIGGYTIANDISMRDWQMRTSEWLQGKAWDATTPVGPVVVTPDEVDDARALAIECAVNGEVKQQGNTSDLLFRPEQLVAYISTFTELLPGDLILTGTTGGVGMATGERTLLVPGDVVTTSISGIGRLTNTIVAEG